MKPFANKTSTYKSISGKKYKVVKVKYDKEIVIICEKKNKAIRFNVPFDLFKETFEEIFKATRIKLPVK